MILWENNQTQNHIKNKDQIVVECDQCHFQKTIKWLSYKKSNQPPNYLCNSCKQLKHYPIPPNHCLDLEATKKLINHPNNYLINQDKIIILCNNCNSSTKIKFHSSKTDLVNYSCHSCKLKEKWQDPDYRNKIENHLDQVRIPTEKGKKQISESVKKNWKTKTYRDKQTKTRSTEEFKEQASKRSKKLWSDPEKRKQLSLKISNLKNLPEEKKAQSQRSLAKWTEKEYRKKALGNNYYKTKEELTERQKRTNQEKQKRHQKHLSIYQIIKNIIRDRQTNSRHPDVDLKFYHLLDLWNQNKGNCALSGIKLSIEPNKLTTISLDRIDQSKGYITGNVQFVCQFLNFAKHTLPNQEIIKLIEDYRRIDNSKGHLKNNIQLTCRFINLGKRTFNDSQVKEFLKLLKETKSTNDKEQIKSNLTIDFKQLKIKKVSNQLANDLVSRYHYSNKIGVKGTNYGVYFQNELISVCIFSHPTRKESYTRLGLKSNEMLELSRFVIHSDYQVKNLASWAISRCIKLIKKEKPELKYLISFADSTHDHIGIIYRASNWKLDGIVKPNYRYQNQNGEFIHKKTIWNQAKKAKLGELQYVIANNLKRIWDKAKYRYLWKY